MISHWDNRKLDGNQLKLIAVVSMLIDHAGLALVGDCILTGIPADGEMYGFWCVVYLAMRSMGRLAFPIYAYLLVEGYVHTRSRERYALRLGAFAVLSEIPFDLLAAGQMVSWKSQNVFFTLFLGLLMLNMLDKAGQRGFAAGRPEIRTVLQLFVIGAVGAAALLVKSDYDYIGILLIAIFYWFRGEPEKQCLTGFFWFSMMFPKWYFICGFAAAFALLYFYSGRRGKGGWKYGYYLLYPVHMAVLAVLRRLIGGV